MPTIEITDEQFSEIKEKIKGIEVKEINHYEDLIGEKLLSSSQSHEELVFTNPSADVPPCKINAVLNEICASGLNSPSFHTCAAMIFFPAFK
jgi:hypothetical protein